MKIAKYLTYLAIVTLTAFFLPGCGSSSPTLPASEVIAIESSFEGGQQKMPVNGSLTATFDRPMDPSSFTEETHYITDGTANTPLNDEWNSDYTVGTFTPAQELSVCTDYIFTIKGGENGIKTAAGGYMEEDITQEFSTEYKYDDEFDDAETLERCWQNTSSLSTYAIADINTTNAGKLTFTFSNTNHTSDALLPILGIPGIYKTVSGNAGISIYVSNSNHQDINGGGVSLTFGRIGSDLASSTFASTTFHWQIDAGGTNSDTFMCAENGQQTESNPNAIAGRTSIYFCLIRNGADITGYKSDDGSTWSLLGVASDLDLSDDLTVIINGKNHSGDDTPVNGYHFSADYIRFNFDDPPACPAF